MNKGVFGVMGFAASLILIVILMSLSFAGDVISFEVDVLAEEEEESVIRVQVPDSIYLGNVSKGEKTDEQRIFANNTGTVDIVVTPQLINSSEEIFRYLYFRGQKTRTVNGTSLNVLHDRIGDFNFNITAPSSANFNDEDFYVVLDLTDYTGDIPADMIRHQADVKFFATSI